MFRNNDQLNHWWSGWRWGMFWGFIIFGLMMH